MSVAADGHLALPAGLHLSLELLPALLHKGLLALFLHANLTLANRWAHPSHGRRQLIAKRLLRELRELWVGHLVMNNRLRMLHRAVLRLRVHHGARAIEATTARASAASLQVVDRSAKAAQTNQGGNKLFVESGHVTSPCWKNVGGHRLS